MDAIKIRNIKCGLLWLSKLSEKETFVKHTIISMDGDIMFGCLCAPAMPVCFLQ